MKKRLFCLSCCSSCVFGFTPNVAISDPKWTSYLMQKKKNLSQTNIITNDNKNNRSKKDGLFVVKNQTLKKRRFENQRSDDDMDNFMHNKSSEFRDWIRKQINGNNNVSSILLAALFTFTVLSGLALNYFSDDVTTTPGSAVIVEQVTEKVLSSSVPTSLPEILSIGLGEALAGFLGASFVYVTSRLPSSTSKSLLRDRERGSSSQSDTVETMTSDVLADTEYFFVRSVSQPLLATTGLPIELVNLFSVLLASLNSELVKFSKGSNAENNEGEKNDKSLNDFDIVELFSDIVKWLEYDVLTTDFEDVIIPTIPGIISSATSKGLVFGSITALSSQLYADLLYRYTNLGSQNAKMKSTSRSNKERIVRYAAKAATGASIFGVYEGARTPFSNAILEVLSGGVDSCVGSTDFDICMETYMLLNEPGATPEAQFRSFITALYGVLDRAGINISDILDFESSMPIINDAGLTETARGAFVTFYSIVHANAPFLEDLLRFSLF